MFERTRSARKCADRNVFVHRVIVVRCAYLEGLCLRARGALAPDVKVLGWSLCALMVDVRHGETAELQALTGAMACVSYDSANSLGDCLGGAALKEAGARSEDTGQF